MDADQIIIKQELSPVSVQLPGDAGKLNRYIFETVQPYIKGSVLEVDSAGGAMTSFFIDHAIPIHLSDPSKINRDKLRERFNATGLIKDVFNIDCHRPDFEEAYSSIFGRFSSLIALNITEHGFYDNMALRNAKLLLRKRGHLLLVAPARTGLYHESEESFLELKQYNYNDLRDYLGNDVEILKTRYLHISGNLNTPPYKALGLSVVAAARKK